MKYIKSRGNGFSYDIHRIAGEMVNIMTNRKLFNEIGELIKGPLPKFTTFESNNVDLEIHPNVGHVILLNEPDKRDTNDNRAANDKRATDDNRDISELHKQCQLKYVAAVNYYGPAVYIPVGNKGTTQYITIENQRISPIDMHISYYINAYSGNFANHSSRFSWFTYNEAHVDISSLYIPWFNSKGRSINDIGMSVSSIIYDQRNVISLPDGKECIDYPLVQDYTIHKQNFLLDRVISIHHQLGINGEIAKHFLPNKLEIVKYYTPTETVTWVKWEDIKPRKPNHLLTLVEQLTQGTNMPFYNAEFDGDIYDDTNLLESTNDEHSDSAVVTKAPVKKPVHKIIKKISIKSNSTTDVNSVTSPTIKPINKSVNKVLTTSKSTASILIKKPVLKKIGSSPLSKTTKLSTLTKSMSELSVDSKVAAITIVDEPKSLNTPVQAMKPSRQVTSSYTCFLSGIPIYEDCYVFDVYKRHVYSLCTTDEAKELMKNDPTAILAPLTTPAKTTTRGRGMRIKGTAQRSKDVKVVTKQKKKKPTNRLRHNNESNSDDEKTADAEPTSNLVLVTESKTKATKDTMITRVRRTITFSEPIQLLISPYAMHHMFKLPLTAISHFREVTGCEFIIYRTFCPRTCKNVIDSLDLSDMHNANIYRMLLHAFNMGFYKSPFDVNYTAKYDKDIVFEMRKFYAMSTILKMKNNLEIFGVYSDE
jgi:hypothetical protein